MKTQEKQKVSRPRRRPSAQEAAHRILKDEILGDFQNPQNPYNPQMGLEGQSYLAMSSLLIVNKFLEEKCDKNGVTLSYDEIGMCTTLLSSVIEFLLFADLPKLAIIGEKELKKGGQG